MSYGALGLVEVLGSCNAVVVLDQMLKTSDVEFRTWHTKCGGHATIFLSGDIAAVKAAVDAVKGNPPCEIIAAAVISAPSEETSRLVKEEEEKHHKLSVNQQMKCRKSFWNMYKDSAVKKCQGIENDVKVVLNQEGRYFGRWIIRV